MEAGAYRVRLDNLEKNYDTLHDSVGRLRSSQYKNGTKIEVLSNQVHEHREDLEEFKKEVNKSIHDFREEVREELKWVKRGAWSLAATFLMFTILLAGFVLQVAIHG